MSVADARLSIVRVHTVPDGAGTGFVVGPGLIVTCHHVVRGATSCSVSVGSVHVPVDQIATTPLRQDGLPTHDVAVLHAAVPSLRELELDMAAPEPGDEFYTFGYTDLYPEGDSALFVYEGPSVEQQETLFRLKSAQARPGLSGAPLISRRTDRTVGVVSRSRGRDSDLGARAVPIAAVVPLLPAASRRTASPADENSSMGSARAHIVNMIAIHERSMRILEIQVAKYGPMDVPVYKQAALEDERTEVERLRLLLRES